MSAAPTGIQQNSSGDITLKESVAGNGLEIKNSGENQVISIKEAVNAETFRKEIDELKEMLEKIIKDKK